MILTVTDTTSTNQPVMDDATELISDTVQSCCKEGS